MWEKPSVVLSFLQADESLAILVKATDPFVQFSAILEVDDPRPEIASWQFLAEGGNLLVLEMVALILALFLLLELRLPLSLSGLSLSDTPHD